MKKRTGAYLAIIFGSLLFFIVLSSNSDYLSDSSFYYLLAALGVIGALGILYFLRRGRN